MKRTLAFVGAGWIADWYYAAVGRLAGSVELVGCCGNPSPEGAARLRQKCATWGVKAYSSYEELLADRSVDCVAIFSPTSKHCAQAVAALRAGKHVLVEKPVALSEADIASVAAAAEKAGKAAFPGHNFVYRPALRKAKEVLDSGALGTLSYASFRAVHFIPPEHAAGWRRLLAESGGGAMMDSGTHLVYQSLYLMGDPEWLGCFSARKHYTSMDGEDVCQISLQYPGGAVGQVFQSWGAADESAGEIRIEGDAGNLLVTDGLYVNGKKVEGDFSYADSFYHTLAAFLAAVEGRSKPLSDLGDAARTLRLIQDAYAAAESRQLVRFRAR